MNMIREWWYGFLQSQVWKAFLAHFGWLDWTVMLFSVAGAFRGLRLGFWNMLFKIAGMIVALFFSIEYSDAVNRYMIQHVQLLPVRYVPMVAFILTVFVFWYAAGLVMKAIAGFFKTKATFLSNILGGVLGAVYAFILASLLAQVLILSPWGNWEKVFSDHGVVMGQSLRDTAPGIYRMLHFSFSETKNP
ncbi:MAG: CvpA family protein [Candidatus Omnitrophota bacterium]